MCRRWLCVALALAPLSLPRVAEAQNESIVRGEARVDAIFARAQLFQAGFGLGFRTGYNVRINFAAAGGVAFKDGEQKGSARGDGTLRLLLDPFGESRIGLSVGGGLSVLYDGFEKTRPVGVIVLGLEGKPRAPLVWSAEVALGGGARVGVVLRRRIARYR
ncbi:MAG TPA: hypothetical protein VH762_02970 [Gemmatimonadaceae bacterium]|jgi:hypothetical protein